MSEKLSIEEYMATKSEAFKLGFSDFLHDEELRRQIMEKYKKCPFEESSEEHDDYDQGFLLAAEMIYPGISEEP